MVSSILKDIANYIGSDGDLSISAKSQLSNHGHRKYLKLGADAAIENDEEKIAADSAWSDFTGLLPTPIWERRIY